MISPSHTTEWEVGPQTQHLAANKILSSKNLPSTEKVRGSLYNPFRGSWREFLTFKDMITLTASFLALKRATFPFGGKNDAE